MRGKKEERKEKKKKKNARRVHRRIPNHGEGGEVEVRSIFVAS